ncbi:BolA-like protein 3 [Taenia crassiceps]|uniref:BolA-like protein 3 n=1 Tax=Taenia crassiceps TaxID=6207 RepID=A0ABR4QFG4_9CEST
MMGLLGASKVLSLVHTSKIANAPSRSAASVVSPLVKKYYPYIGNREIVGFGRNGNPQYLDDLHFPYPSIRFRENDDFEALRKKELGDWKDLTIDEKKQLYRHSFRMTLAETVAPHPRWKLGVAWACFVMSAAMLYLSFLKSCVLNLPTMKYTQKDYKEALLYRRLYSRDGPIDGLFSRGLLVATAFRRSLATQAETKIKSLLKARFPNAVAIDVTDVSGGCGAMYQIFVKSKEFSGMSVLAQHRSVKEVGDLSSTIFVS